VLSIVGHVNGVAALFQRSVRNVVGTIAVVVGLGWYSTRWANDADREQVSSNEHVTASAVDCLDGEVSLLACLVARFKTYKMLRQ